MVKVSSLMSLTRKKATATEPTQERTVAAEVVTKMANAEEAEKAVDAEVAVEEATEKDAEEATVAPREEVLQMEDATESEPTLLMKTETLLLTVLRPADTERDTRASQEKVTTHSTESPELAAEEETTAELAAVMAGVKIRRRSQKPLMVKRPRESSQPVKTTETEEETTVTETRKDVPRETLQSRRKSPRRKLDSLLMTTKPRRRLVTSRLPPEDSTRRSTRRVSSPTMSRRSALR